MPARSQKKIRKSHELRKRVKMENKRLRARGPKKHAQKPTIKPSARVHIKLEADAKIALRKYCNEHGVKPYKAIKQILKMMIDKDYQDLKKKFTSGELQGIIDGIQA